MVPILLNSRCVTAVCMIAVVGIAALSGCRTGSPNPVAIQVIQTSRDGDHLAHKATLTFSPDDGSTNSALAVDPQTTHQSIIGFGGALTEISAVLLKQIPAEKRAEVLHAFFSPEGAAWSLCRTHINSTTFFPTGQYNYDDVPGDFELRHFDISHDLKYLVPLIKDAQTVKGAKFQMLSTPWTPPGWMKASGKMEGGAPLKPECYDAWALYFSKYIKAYAEQGIPINFVTVQNESEYFPEWNGCVYTPAQQKEFVQKHLGPRLEKDGLHAKILIFDHNTDHIANWADAIYPDKEGSAYIWGTAFHWYQGDHFENVKAVHDRYPQKHLLFTEGCQDAGGHVFEWAPAERYARSIIGDLNCGTEGWIDLNMTLDETGGPVPENIKGDGWRTSAQIMVNSKTGELIYNPYHFVFSHFSKYVRPGALRIEIKSNPRGLESTAFKNLDGTIVVIVFNPGDNAVPIKLVEGHRAANAAIPAHAVVNYIFR